MKLTFVLDVVAAARIESATSHGTDPSLYLGSSDPMLAVGGDLEITMASGTVVFGHDGGDSSWVPVFELIWTLHQVIDAIRERKSGTMELPEHGPILRFNAHADEVRLDYLVEPPVSEVIAHTDLIARLSTCFRDIKHDALAAMPSATSDTRIPFEIRAILDS
ncbi:MAG: hypothetical protein IT303_01940 [Dehalococcoidia bacterium]|nr:hypothetical protein [Dehalococcoidia bacterium]